MTATVSTERARRQVICGLALSHWLAEIARVFGERDIDYVLMKGPAFARWLYDDPSERPYRDIDLLVAPDCREAAEGVLADLGFEPGDLGRLAHELPGHHRRWACSRPMPALVELHHTLCLVPAPPAVVWSVLSAGARSIEVSGARVEIPSEAACALIAALHAAQHGVGAPQPLRDLDRAIERTSIEMWRAAAALARELGAGEAFAAGLRLDRGGTELADRLGLSARAPRLVRLRGGTLPDVALGVERLTATPGVRARLRLLARELAPSPAFMRAWRPVARRGRRGLVLAYAWRPFWLVVKLPRAIRAWLVAATPQSRIGDRRGSG